MRDTLNTLTCIHIHTCASLSLSYSRQGVIKYSEEVYQEAMRCFDALPICAVVSGECGKFFCTHGGLSPFIRTVRADARIGRLSRSSIQMEDISNLDRFQDVPTQGPFWCVNNSDT